MLPSGNTQRPKLVEFHLDNLFNTRVLVDPVMKYSRTLTLTMPELPANANKNMLH